MISHGVKLAVLSFILTAAAGVLTNIATPSPGGITYSLVFNLDAAALLIAFLSWQAPSVAAGLFSGAPALHAGVAARVAGGTAFALGRLSSSATASNTSSLQQVTAAARASGRGLQALTAGAGALVGAARGGAAIATLNGAGPLAAARGAMSGVTRLGLSSAGNIATRAGDALRSGAGAATAGLRQSWQSGHVAGFRSAWGVTRPQP